MLLKSTQENPVLAHAFFVCFALFFFNMYVAQSAVFELFKYCVELVCVLGCLPCHL